MKKENLLIVILIALIACINESKISAQTATITFTADKNVGVRIYKPIDNAFNSYVVSNEIVFTPNGEVDYQVPVVDFCFVMCEYTDGSKYVLVLEDGSHLKVQYTEAGIKMQGDNSEGIIYYNNEYINKGLLPYRHKIDSIFTTNIDGNINFEAIDTDILNEKANSYQKDIEKMKEEGLVTPRFATILLQDLQYAYNYIVFDIYQNVLAGRINNYKPTLSDSLAIKEQIEKFYDVPTLLNENTLKYRYANVSTYYFFMYRTIETKEKDELLKSSGEDEDTFGPYVARLLAPDYIQKPLLGSDFVMQFKYMLNEFDKNKMLSYFERRFPDSEYIPVIKEYINTEKAKENDQTTSDSPSIIEEDVQSLKELTGLEGIQGKYIYIDLWATWCIPCKQEFQYNKDVHKLLDTYSNLAAVYISMDEDQFDKKWRNDVKQFSLTGYNLRASEALQKDILKRIYKGSKTYNIPLYVLIDPEGNIIDDNLPRPSSIDQGKRILNRF
ncbi:hypothetical protein FACS189474_2390 [Bacteroidia bacterium]|nr:hypothetical protein FACS189474_2390 [Bacteroidia bacterium]